MTITADRHGGQGHQRTFRPRQAQGKQHAKHSSAYVQHMADSCRHRHAELSDIPGFPGSDVCLSAAAPGAIPSKPGFHPGPSGRKAGCTQAKQGVKEGVRAIMAGIVWRNSPHYAHFNAGQSGIRRKNSSWSLRGVKGYLDLCPGEATESATRFTPISGKTRMRI